MEIAAINVSRREYQKLYMDYWNSTVNETGTGRPVDAFVSPVTPYASVTPTGFQHDTYTCFANTLDYSSVALPVTHADRSVDVVDTTFEPFSPEDKRVQETCEFSPLKLKRFMLLYCNTDVCFRDR